MQMLEYRIKESLQDDRIIAIMEDFKNGEILTDEQEDFLHELFEECFDEFVSAILEAYINRH